MAESARSIVVRLGNDLHLAFDTELNRVHTIWRGGPLNLWGPPYSYAKSAFICDFDGKAVYSFPQLPPWWVSESPAETRFHAIDTTRGEVQFLFDVHCGDDRVRVRESARGEANQDAWTVLRRFHFVAGNPHELQLLALAEAGAKVTEFSGGVQIEGTNGIFNLKADGMKGLSWFVRRDPVKYTNEIITEAGTEKGNPRVVQSGSETRVFLAIPRHSAEFSIDLLLSSDADPENPAAPGVTPISPAVFEGAPVSRRDSGDAFYRIEHFPLPPEAEMMITGMDWTASGEIAVCTWLGEVYLVQNPTGAVTQATYRRIARGLNEPLGLAVRGNDIYIVQKGELTRLVDRDGDGEVDFLECVSAAWGFSGNYHSYTFGPLITPGGEFFIFTTGQRARYDLPYQGWALQITPDGQVLGFCDGLRVPHGWGMYGPGNDIFTTDNEGNWMGTCRLNHLQPGRFYGYPSSIPSPNRVRAPEEVQAPALWLPRVVSPSASGIATIQDPRFGPFKGQMLIGDFQNATVLRAFLEKIDGQWQGAVFPFAKGFLSGVNRLSLGPDGKLYVGGGKRTWSTAAPKEYSLDRLSYTGRLPFEVQAVRATADGFELTFTKELDAEAAADPENYLVKQFTYKYHPEYGSPEFDHEGKPGATEIPVQAARLGSDKRTVRLTIPGLQIGYVTSFQLAVTNSEDEEPRHDLFWYTLNRRPR